MRVCRGEVFDVVVDLRKSSPTFGQWEGCLLSSSNHYQLWIPPGFAHGFLTLSDEAEFLYKTTDYWHPQVERTLLWSDPTLQIEWPFNHTPTVSPKDNKGVSFHQAETYP